MLNSLYGRFNIKEIESTIKIITDKEYNDKINKQFHHTVLSELDYGHKLVKYGDKINENLRK